jgi:hypothetical protein
LLSQLRKKMFFSSSYLGEKKCSRKYGEHVDRVNRLPHCCSKGINFVLQELVEQIDLPTKITGQLNFTEIYFSTHLTKILWISG